MLFVLKQKKCVNQIKGKLTLITFPWGRISLAIGWRSGSFCKQKSKDTKKVEINQFCDG